VWDTCKWIDRNCVKKKETKQKKGRKKKEERRKKKGNGKKKRGEMRITTSTAKMPPAKENGKGTANRHHPILQPPNTQPVALLPSTHYWTTLTHTTHNVSCIC